MSTSRDVKALFDRFGGDVSSYREIRMENEADDARARWPLLGMIDPRQVPLAASESPGHAIRGAAAPLPEADTAASSAANVLLPHSRSHAALRRTAPLFTRSPRRDIPPAAEKQRPSTPESAAYRFTPAPIEGDAGKVVTTPAAVAATVQAAPQPQTQDGPSGFSVNGAAIPIVRSAALDASASAPVPGAPAAPTPRAAQPARAAGGILASVPSAAPSSPSGAAAVSSRVIGRTASASIPSRPAAAAAAAPSPLKKLFGEPGAPSQPADAPAAPADEGRLDSLFARLRRGGATTTAEPSPAKTGAPRRPWFLNGVGRS